MSTKRRSLTKRKHSWFERLLCAHDYKFVPLERPFYGYPLYDKDGYWMHDIYLHVCSKCGDVVWLDDTE